jgi:paspaline synthase
MAPADLVDMPYAPLWFQHTQNGLVWASGILWSLAYAFYVRQAFRDRSYGMPILSLCANITWEFIYGLMPPTASTAAPTVIATTWMVLDLGLVYTTLKFGAGEWHHSPLVARHLPAILSVVCLVFLVVHWSFARLFDDDHRLIPCFWSAFACQALLSWLGLAQLISRGHTRGHSMTIWVLRLTGTQAAIAAWLFRTYYYPIEHHYADSLFAWCLFGLSIIGDLWYPVVFRAVKGAENPKIS